jgi:hypothetical protein
VRLPRSQQAASSGTCRPGTVGGRAAGVPGRLQGNGGGSSIPWPRRRTHLPEAGIGALWQDGVLPGRPLGTGCEGLRGWMGVRGGRDGGCWGGVRDGGCWGGEGPRVLGRARCAEQAARLASQVWHGDESRLTSTLASAGRGLAASRANHRLACAQRAAGRGNPSLRIGPSCERLHGQQQPRPPTTAAVPK